jgi:hypothetical protein
MFSSFLVLSFQFFEYTDSCIAGTRPLVAVVLAFQHLHHVPVIGNKSIKISSPALGTFASKKWRLLSFSYRSRKLVDELPGIFRQPGPALLPAFLREIQDLRKDFVFGFIYFDKDQRRLRQRRISSAPAFRMSFSQKYM